MRGLIPLLGLALAACASTEVTSSSPGTVVVKASKKRAGEAQATAELECAKYGKAADLRQTVDANEHWASYFFACK